MAKRSLRDNFILIALVLGGVIILTNLYVFTRSIHTVFNKDKSSSDIQKQPTTKPPKGAFTFNTSVSQKPRDKTITYTISRRETITEIARKFGITENTIRWENNLENDILTSGQKLQILPVTGVSHKVVQEETLQSVAKKYQTDPQKIADFPFNKFADPEKHTLIPGEKMIIPDGKK